jgi:hypothetical protein
MLRHRYLQIFFIALSIEPSALSQRFAPNSSTAILLEV